MATPEMPARDVASPSVVRASDEGRAPSRLADIVRCLMPVLGVLGGVAVTIVALIVPKTPLVYLVAPAGISLAVGSIIRATD
jgi:hypothetical protein